VLLPQVINLVGEQQMVFGTDMPHGDRERFAGRELAKRKDISDSAKGDVGCESEASVRLKLTFPCLDAAIWDNLGFRFRSVQ
jgi:hypothetical protein